MIEQTPEKVVPDIPPEIPQEAFDAEAGHFLASAATVEMGARYASELPRGRLSPKDNKEIQKAYDYRMDALAINEDAARRARQRLVHSEQRGSFLGRLGLGR
jgi:hypothetical protein